MSSLECSPVVLDRNGAIAEPPSDRASRWSFKDFLPFPFKATGSSPENSREEHAPAPSENEYSRVDNLGVAYNDLRNEHVKLQMMFSRVKRELMELKAKAKEPDQKPEERRHRDHPLVIEDSPERNQLAKPDDADEADAERHRQILYEVNRKLHADALTLAQENSRLKSSAQTTAQQMNILHEERRNLKTQLQEARLSTNTKISSLEAFDHKLDQVSESSIRSGSQASVEGLNEAIDTLTSEILEEATFLLVSVPRVQGEISSVQSINPIDMALRLGDLNEENRDLLLDAWTHNFVVSEIQELFFSCPVVPFPAANLGILEDLFRSIIQKGLWFLYITCSLC